MNIPSNISSIIMDIKSLAPYNTKVYIVGGAVRDYFFNVEPKDYDLLVSGIDPDSLIVLLESKGHVVDQIGKSFGILLVEGVEIAFPRREKSTGAGYKDFEIHIDPYMEDISTDLLRRDFTINAIAYDYERHSFIDPCEGIKHISQRKLVPVFEDTYNQDPVRILRAYKFVSRYDLSYDIPFKTPSLKNIKPNRIYSEIKKITSNWEDVFGHFYDLIPEILEMQGCKQNQKYHNNSVLQHTLQVIRHNDKMNYRLAFACLLHDIGKPATLTRGDDGIYHNYGHQKVGAEMTRTILKRLKFSNKDIEYISELVYNHMKINDTTHKKTYRKIYNKYGKDFLFDLWRLHLADRSSRRYWEIEIEETENEIIVKFHDHKNGQIKQICNIDTRAPFKLVINGHDIMNITGAEGKDIGDIKKHLTDLVLSDNIENDKEILTTYLLK